nr:MAG TPA: hypothetical protein [Caudoviricetes sp.]
MISFREKRYSKILQQYTINMKVTAEFIFFKLSFYM